MAPSRWKRSQSGSSLRSPPTGCEEPLGRGVRPHHQGHVAQAGEDLGPGVVDGLGPRGAGGVGRRDPGPGPAQRLGEGGTGDEARVAVADGVGPGDVLDVGPRQVGLAAGRPRPRPTRTRRSCGPTSPTGACPRPVLRPACRQARASCLPVVRSTWSHPSRPGAATSTPGTRGRRPRRGCRAPAPPRPRP